MRFPPFPYRTALAAGILLLAFGVHAAGNFTVQNGTWVVTSEVDGKPGRGMTIDAQDGMLVLAVYNYEISGQPSFHLATGKMTGNHFSGSLTRYENGRYFGSGPLDAQEGGSAGIVQIDFDTGSTGTIQFPGEPAVAISRFNFDEIAAGLLSRSKVNEQWLMAELDADGRPVNALLIHTGETTVSPSPQKYPAIIAARSFKDGNGAFTLCSYGTATQKFTCDIQFDSTGSNRKLEWSKNLESMSGRISGADSCTMSPCPPTWRRVVGMRLGMDYSAVRVDAQMDAPAATMSLPDYKITPDPGMWVVSTERATGKPGRGMSIDVQYDNSVMLTYNYEQSGAPTFHMGISPYADNKSTAHLIRYEGGRYFGGPAVSAQEVADAGEVRLQFLTPILGKVQFPGEPEVPMERFEFGAANPSPQSLYGDWIFFAPDVGEMRHYTFDAAPSGTPTEAWGTGSIGGFPVKCSYPGAGVAYAVKCDDASPVFHHVYRFTPVNGRAIGQRDDQGASNVFYALRVKDRNGRLTGLGRF